MTKTELQAKIISMNPLKENLQHYTAHVVVWKWREQEQLVNALSEV
ncbi:hypothetical protein [Pseudomonas sp. M30-35]|nr:hypothetical protein [Pseudomonas sp. M30-35]